MSNAPNPHHVTVSSAGSKFISWEFVLDPELVVLSMFRSATVSLRTKCEGIRKRWARGTRRERTARSPGADHFTGNPGPPSPLGDGITSPVWKPPGRKAEQSPGIHPSGRGCDCGWWQNPFPTEDSDHPSSENTELAPGFASLRLSRWQKRSFLALGGYPESS